MTMEVGQSIMQQTAMHPLCLEHTNAHTATLEVSVLMCAAEAKKGRLCAGVKCKSIQLAVGSSGASSLPDSW